MLPARTEVLRGAGVLPEVLRQHVLPRRGGVLPGWVRALQRRLLPDRPVLRRGHDLLSGGLLLPERSLLRLALWRRLLRRRGDLRWRPVLPKRAPPLSWQDCLLRRAGAVLRRP